MEHGGVAQQIAGSPPGTVPLAAARRLRSDPLWRFAARLVAIWGIANLAASVLWNPQVTGIFRALPGALSLLAQAVAVVVTEGLLAALVFSAAGTLGRSNSPACRWMGRAALGVAGLALAAAMVLVAASWFLRAHHLDFVVPSLAQSVLVAPSSIAPLLTAREYLLLFLAAAAALAVSVALIAAAPASTPRRLLLLALVCAGFGSVPTVALRMSPNPWITTAQVARLQGAIESELLPGITLFWAPLVAAHQEPAPPSAMRLEDRYGLNTYSQRIQRSVRRPNILIFVVESLRADAVRRQIGGRPVMKVVSGLSRQGLNFTRAYAASNETVYSLAAILGGIHPLKYKGRDSLAGPRHEAPGLADLLSPVYRTAFLSSADESWQNMIGVSASPRLDFFFHARDFSGPVPPPDPADPVPYQLLRRGLLRGTLDDRTTADALHAWLGKALDGGAGRPFHAMVSYQASHFPYQYGFHVPAPFTPSELTPAEHASMEFLYYPREFAPVMRNRYWNSLAYIDALIGETIDLLRRRNVLDNTILIVTGDHGESFHEDGAVTHSGRLTESSIHTGLVVWGARRYGSGDYTHPVGMVDLGPMVLDLASMPEFRGFQGSVPQGVRLGGPAPAGRSRPIFLTAKSTVFEDGVIEGRWKFVAGALGSGNRLYDLETDPGETRNLVSERAGVGACLQDTLQSFRASQLAYYRDPLLKSRKFPPRHDTDSGKNCADQFGR